MKEFEKISKGLKTKRPIVLMVNAVQLKNLSFFKEMCTLISSCKMFPFVDVWKSTITLTQINS